MRILRAFAWLRWRMLINSLEKTAARDKLERFSIAIEKLGPIMAAVLMIPSAIALAIVGTAAGFALGRGDERPLLFEAARYLLFIVPVLSLVGPLFLPAADRTNPVRMLLLPIPRSTLYVAQSATVFGDVWILLTLPVVLFVPIGLSAAGAFGSALFAIVAGLLLLLVLVALSSLATSVLHLIFRDRRRGEVLALLFILVVPAVSMLPGLLNAGRHLRSERGDPARQGFHLPAWATTAGQRAFALYPSELYVHGTRAIAGRQTTRAGTRLAALGATAAALHMFGMFVFARVLASPGSSGARRSVTAREAWGRTLPGLSPGASAVALAQLRLVLRTPRGRSILLSPLVMMGIFAVVTQRAGLAMGPITSHGGVGFATFTSFVCLFATLPILMNQFAVDKAGMTLALLSPLSDGEYLRGKAVGNALIAFPPALVCLIVARAIYRGGSLALWSAVPLSWVSTYLLVSAPAAMLSALFPRMVDLNSIGRGSNAHGLAGLLGMLTFVAAAATNLAIVLAATAWLDRIELVPILLIAWCGVSFIICRLLFVVARRVFAARRENLALLLSDR